MTRDTAFRILIGALLLAAGAWLVWATEWVEVDVEQPPRGEAAKNALYATQHLARGLGANVVRRTGLDALPATGARLVLASRHWDLFPERAGRLHAWVEQGGHLVIPAWMISHEGLGDWLTIRFQDSSDDDDEEEGIRRRKRPKRPAECRELTEPEGLPPTYPGSHVLRICASPYVQALQSGSPPLWAAHGNNGAELLRAAVGRGSVTVIGPWDMLQNRRVLREDNALLITAALQLRQGVDIWFVAEEAREALLPWVWHTAWPAVLLGLLALAAALWRGGVRFGPRVAPAGHQRRSMTEQVLGTAQFLHLHGGQALLRAQLRALDEAARAVLRGHAMLNIPARARAIAALTGLDAAALTRAMDPSRPVSPYALALQLELLESARRRLLEARTRAAPTAAPPSPPSS